MRLAYAFEMELAPEQSEWTRKFFESIQKPEQIITITLGDGTKREYLAEDLMYLENGDGSVTVQCNIIGEVEPTTTQQGADSEKP